MRWLSPRLSLGLHAEGEGGGSRVASVIPAKERVKNRNCGLLEDSAASFPRRRESIYQAGTSSYMGTRLRGYDAAAF